jgi:hypothetical protein
MTDNNFRINPSNYLGNDHQQYQNDMYAIALSQPEKYFRLRRQVLQRLKTDAIGDVYTKFYDFLVEGDIGGTNALEGNKPCYPKQKVSELALSAANTLDKILDHIIEIVLPIDYKDISLKRLQDKGTARGI